MFRHCPSCASRAVRFEEDKRVYCPDCGLVYYHNTAAATGCIIDSGGAIVLLVRGQEPARGKLDLPGGFIEPGEGALEGLRRECREELGWDPLAAYPGADFSFVASFPNVYPYRDFSYNTCDLFFSFDAPGLDGGEFRPQDGEVDRIALVPLAEIDYREIAFESAGRAIRFYAESRLNRK